MSLAVSGAASLGGKAGRRLSKRGIWDSEPVVEYAVMSEEDSKTLVLPTLAVRFGRFTAAKKNAGVGG